MEKWYAVHKKLTGEISFCTDTSQDFAGIKAKGHELFEIPRMPLNGEKYNPITHEIEPAPLSKDEVSRVALVIKDPVLWSSSEIQKASDLLKKTQF